MFAKLLIATALLPLAWAFSDSTPFVAWSSHRPVLLDASPGSRLEASRAVSPLDVVLNNGELCELDAVMIIDQPGLHANNLKGLSPSAVVPNKLKGAVNSIQLPYTSPQTSDSVVDAAESLARRCGMRLVQYHGEADHWPEFSASEKAVYYLLLPPVSGLGGWAKDEMSGHDQMLSKTLSAMEATLPHHIVVYIGTIKQGSNKRQVSAIDTRLPFSFDPKDSEGGIFQRYQLLTPGLIVSLLIVLFLLIPVILLAVRALAGIQSSIRLDAPKGPSLDKKNQ